MGFRVWCLGFGFRVWGLGLSEDWKLAHLLSPLLPFKFPLLLHPQVPNTRERNLPPRDHLIRTARLRSIAKRGTIRQGSIKRAGTTASEAWRYQQHDEAYDDEGGVDVH